MQPTPVRNHRAIATWLLAVVGVLPVFTVLAPSGHAAAQACHGGAAAPSTDYFSTALLLRGGLSDAAHGTDFEGLALDLNASIANVHIGLLLPAYRLGLDAPVVRMGDLSAAVGYSLPIAGSAWALSASLAAGFPTGDDTKGSGMGMYMLTPSVTALFKEETFALGLTFGYATHVVVNDTGEEDPHAHHHGSAANPRPTVSSAVDPHYHQELWTRPSATLFLSNDASITLAATGAIEASMWKQLRLGVEASTEYKLTPAWSLLGRIDYRLSNGPQFVMLEFGAQWSLR